MGPNARDVPGEAARREVVIVAHRAGNLPETARHALTPADLIELDLHVLRGRVEVRHEKVLRPTSRLWERWYMLPKGTRAVGLDDILAVVGPDTHLLIDLKCFTVRAARRIRDTLPSTHPVTASSRSWWVLRAFVDRPGARVLRSCGNRMQLRLAQMLPGLGSRVGVSAHERLLDARAIGSITSRTPLLFSWGAATAARGEELVAAGVSGLIVDDLELGWPR